MTDFDRARAYVARMPPAISGKGGDGATFAVAKVLIHDFALSESEGWQILLEYNKRCSPPWNERELRHKMESAKNLTRAKRGRGALANNRPNLSAYCPIPRRKPICAREPEPRTLGKITIEMFEEPAQDKVSPGICEGIPSEEPHLLVGAEVLSEETVDINEARRVATELIRLYRAGAISGPGDPEAVFYVCLIRDFGATFLPGKN